MREVKEGALQHVRRSSLKFIGSRKKIPDGEAQLAPNRVGSKTKADRKDVINDMNVLSKSILEKCIGKRVEEQVSDSTLPDSEVEEETLTGDTEESSGSLLRWADEVVEEVLRPPTPR